MRVLSVLTIERVVLSVRTIERVVLSVKINERQVYLGGGGRLWYSDWSLDSESLRKLESSFFLAVTPRPMLGSRRLRWILTESGSVIMVGAGNLSLAMIMMVVMIMMNIMIPGLLVTDDHPGVEVVRAVIALVLRGRVGAKVPGLCNEGSSPGPL